MELMFGPLAHKELVTFLPRQSVEKLQETETHGSETAAVKTWKSKHDTSGTTSHHLTSLGSGEDRVIDGSLEK